MRFLCKKLQFGLIGRNYFRFCANVCLAVIVRRQQNRHYFKWIQSKIREKEKFVVACLRPQAKLSISDGREIRPKSVRHAADAK